MSCRPEVEEEQRGAEGPPQGAGWRGIRRGSLAHGRCWMQPRSHERILFQSVACLSLCSEGHSGY